MQRFIFKQKNKIIVLSAILIVTGFIARYAFNNITIFEITFIIASIIGVAPIALQAYQSLRVKVISIDVLVTIAVIGAFIIKAYEESAIVTFLFLFGGYLELRTLQKTRSAIKELTELAPEVALKKLADDTFIEVDIDDINIDDVVLVKTGSRVPVDGVVSIGEGHINEASITGESIAVSKEVGSKVFAGSILENGTLQVVAKKVGEDTTFGKIIELVEEAQDSKSEAERFIDKFSTYYTPAVLLIAFIVFLFTKNVELSITILVLGCPGALVIGVPVSNVAGIGNGARNGILLKGSEVISDFSRVDVIAFDKTGTLTTGNPYVSDHKYYVSDTKLVDTYLYSIESESSHPLANAVIKHLGVLKQVNVNETKVIKGGGIVAFINKDKVVVGNYQLIKDQKIELTKEMIKDIEQYEKLGNSIVLTAINNKLHSIIGIRDQIRPNIKEQLINMKKLGVKTLVVLSGDNQGTVDLVAKELEIDLAYGNMLPQDKSKYIKNLQKEGKVVAFIGDGINDSPSLALANIGIAMGSGTDVAIETSDVVLMNSDFSKIPHALGLTKATKSNMIQNILISIGVVLFLLVSLLFAKWMNMSIGMLLHELSILVVVLNGMRLLKYKNKR